MKECAEICIGVMLLLRKIPRNKTETHRNGDEDTVTSETTHSLS